MIDDVNVAAVALVTCAQLPDLDPDDRLLLPALAARGLRASVVAWDDPGVAWDAFDLVVLRNPWDYTGRRDQFVAWAIAVPRLANPAEVIAWNTDKRYLAELAAKGVPTVPTRWVGPADPWQLPAQGEWVVKPAVGAGSRDTGRYDALDAAHRELAAAHVARLQAAGRLAMVQPYLAAVDRAGETGLVFLGGEYSHAIRKGPMLTGPDDPTMTGLFRPEQISGRLPTADELEVAQQALAVVPGGPERLLYARVDLIPDADGNPLVVEVELTEPSLFLATAPDSPALLADAVLALVESLVA